MTTLLALAGVVVGVVIGLAIGRARRSGAVTGPPVPSPAVATTATGALDAAIDLHPTGVSVADAAGRITYRNVAASVLHGTHTGTLLEAAVERHLKAARAGATSREVVEFYGPPRVAFQVMAVPVAGGGSVAFVDDISERRRLDQVRTDFVANVSHELKTPIGALAVLAETLEDGSDPVTVERIVRRMLAETDRASHTIDRLMELSRIESGGEAVREPVSVADLVRGAVERVSEMARRQEITISVLEPVAADGTRASELVVIGDRSQLVSALGNLVENAVKYSEPGASVQVRAARAGDAVEISVVDHGVGIPARDVDRIFERFYRVDRARSRTTGGTGLGLSIVRHVATNHGGGVRVTSVEGEGSTFVLTLAAASGRRDHGDPSRDEGVA